MSGKSGPEFKISLRHKQDKSKRLRAFAVWPGKYGWNVAPEKSYKGSPEVVALVVRDGDVEKRVYLADYFIDMDRPRARDGHDERDVKAAEDAYGPPSGKGGGDDIPF